MSNQEKSPQQHDPRHRNYGADEWSFDAGAVSIPEPTPSQEAMLLDTEEFAKSSADLQRALSLEPSHKAFGPRQRRPRLAVSAGDRAGK